MCNVMEFASSKLPPYLPGAIEFMRGLSCEICNAYFGNASNFKGA